MPVCISSSSSLTSSQAKQRIVRVSIEKLLITSVVPQCFFDKPSNTSPDAPMQLRLNGFYHRFPLQITIDIKLNNAKQWVSYYTMLI